MTAASCDLKSPIISAKPRAVSVNGVTIPRDDIARETQNHAAKTPIDAWKQAARALVVRELLIQEAKRLGVVAEPVKDDEGRRETDDEAAMRALMEREVVTPVADEAACRRYYDNNRAKFRSPDLFEARHILLPVDPKDKAGRSVTLEMARAALAELKQSPERFSDMAAAISACPSGKTGGSLGQIGPGQTVPEFEKALASLAVGSLAPEPVETRYGFHIVWLDRRIKGRELPFEMVEERIAGWLNEKVRRVAVQQYLTILSERASIEGIEMHTTSPAQAN
jgi:peptidyl-prolyl cis-trans isomerase C